MRGLEQIKQLNTDWLQREHQYAEGRRREAERVRKQQPSRSINRHVAVEIGSKAGQRQVALFPHETFPAFM